MKKNQMLALAVIGLPVFILVTHSCTKQSTVADKKAADANTAVTMQTVQSMNARTATLSSDTCHSCGKYFNGTHAGTGNYVYPDIPLDLSCAVANTTVTLGAVYYDVPNRFTIYDKNGNVAVTTGWIGWAHCPGPWGTSVTTAQAETYVSFTYNTSLAPYKLRVETVVTGCNGCSTDPGCTDQDDNWQAHIMCVTSSGTTCTGGSCPTDSCNTCNKYFNATHAGTGFYVYPDYPLNLTCAVSNSTVTIGGTYYDVPNRFTVYDKNGNVVATTGWIGWAHCPGPWGMSVTTAQAETFINFTYNTSLAPYKLRVETVVTGCNGCSTDPGCTDQDDNWQAHVMCITP